MSESKTSIRAKNSKYLVGPEKVVHELFQGLEAKTRASMRGLTGVLALALAWWLMAALPCAARRPEKCL